MDPQIPETTLPPGHGRLLPLTETVGQPHSCPPEVRLRVLRRVHYFQGLDQRQLEDIDSRMRSLAWAESDYLYTAGEPAAHLFVLASGRAKAFRDTTEGQQVIVDLLGPGDLFGGLPTLGQEFHTETVYALSDTCALRVDTEVFSQILRQYPSVALKVLETLADQLRSAHTTLTERHGSPVLNRVAAVLLRLAEKFGQRTSQGLLIDFPLSRADLAGITGSTPESVSRAMSQMRKDGVIDSGRRWTAITDPQRLKLLAE